MPDLFKDWAVLTASILTIGYILDLWVDPKISKKFGSHFLSLLKKQSLELIHGVGEFFIDLFDKVYGSNHSSVERTVWKGLLFSYLIFLFIRPTLALFQVRVPPTEFLLLIAIGTSFSTVLLFNSLFENSELFALYRGDRFLDVLKKTSPKSFVITLAAGMVGLSLFSLMTVSFTNNIGINPRGYGAIAFGTMLVLPSIMFVSLVPNRFLSVNPLRSFLSSLIFMIVISFVFPGAFRSFYLLVQDKGFIFLTFIAFNMFADTVSLVETRWLLENSLKVKYVKIFLLLSLDLILSASIYLILPAIVNQNFTQFFIGVIFRGDMPWIGILFWTTFSTSIIFYIFIFVAITSIERKIMQLF